MPRKRESPPPPPTAGSLVFTNGDSQMRSVSSMDRVMAMSAQFLRRLPEYPAVASAILRNHRGDDSQQQVTAATTLAEATPVKFCVVNRPWHPAMSPKGRVRCGGIDSKGGILKLFVKGLLMVHKGFVKDS